MRAAEPQAERLQRMGYSVEQLHLTDTYLSTFATVELAQRIQKLIRDVHDASYTPEQSSQLYPTVGDTTDWTYGIYQIPSFTIELRPHTQAEGGFILPPGQIQPTWEENQPASLEFIQRVL